MAPAIAAAVLAVAPGAAGAHTKTVFAGGPVKFQNSIQKTYGAGVNNFLINRVTINVGDSVVWNGKSKASGFHSVDFPAKGQGDLPLIIPSGGLVSGANDFNGTPFWFNGHVPNLGFNPNLFHKIGGSTYNGSSRVDSGLPTGKPANFKLKFSKPGVYKYYCDVHYGMIGYVVVKKAGRKIPSAKADRHTLAKEEAFYVKHAKKLDKTKPTGNNVSVGASGPGGLEVFAMFPHNLTVNAGTTVKFSMSAKTRETHTATFGPQAYVMNLANSFAGPAPSPIAAYPSDPPGTSTLNATSHGNGFANTGAMDQDSTTPLGSSGSIKFTQAGTYQYVCLIHPFMHGTITVK